MARLVDVIFVIFKTYIFRNFLLDLKDFELKLSEKLRLLILCLLFNLIGFVYFRKFFEEIVEIIVRYFRFLVM